MTRFKRKSNLKFDKGKNILILFLCVTLFFAASSVTLSLFKKDKSTSSPVPEPPKPICQVHYSIYDLPYDRSVTMINLKPDDTFENVCSFTVDDNGDEEGEVYFYFDTDVYPVMEGSKVVMEFDYTMTFQAFEYVGMLIDDFVYGFDSSNPLPDGTHNVRIEYDGLAYNYYPEDEVYSNYNFTVFVDGQKVNSYNGSLLGLHMEIDDCQGIGFMNYMHDWNIENGETFFVLHNLTLKVY